MSRPAGSPKILLGLTGLNLGGGIASVSRAIARVVDRGVAAGRLQNASRVVLYETPPPETELSGGGGFPSRRKIGFAARLWLRILATRPDLVLFDHVGLGRSLVTPLPLPRPAFDVFVHGLELVGAENDSRADVLRAARRLLANSSFTAEQLAARMPELREKIRVVSLCVEPERVELWKKLAVERSEVAREPAALIVGRMWSGQPGKGHAALIQGWPRVLESLPTAELWIVGEGDDVGRFQEMARTAGCARSVRFFGRVTDEELEELYARASVFAMPSAQEGFGLVYIEAMWHGLPCIGSTRDAAGCVIDASCGVLVPFDDPERTARAVVDLLTDPERRDRMGEAGRLRVEREFGFGSFERRLLEGLGVGDERDRDD
jgi:phosphatidylinositol alpha-1,6-mannosyltransferase